MALMKFDPEQFDKACAWIVAAVLLALLIFGHHNGGAGYPGNGTAGWATGEIYDR